MKRILALTLVAAIPACGLLIDIKDLTPAEGEPGFSDNDGSVSDGMSKLPTDASGGTDAGKIADGSDGGCGDVSMNANNCGRCGHSCLGGDCLGGSCQPKMIGALAGEVSSVAVDSTSVYFASFDYNTGAVARVAKTGGAVSTFASGADTRLVKRVAVNGSHVYWACADTGSGIVSRCPVAGCVGAPEVLANPGEPTGLTLDPTFVTWADHNGGQIARKPIDGGVVKLVAMTSGALPVAVVVEPPRTFWLNDFSGEVYGNIPADGGSVLLGSAGQSGRDLVIVPGAPSFLYWGTAGTNVGDPGTIARVPADKSSAVQTLGVANGDPRALAIDAKLVYWTARATASDGGVVAGAVFACPQTGCGAGATKVAVNQDLPWGIAVDNDAIYWGVRGGVMKLAKP